MTEHSIVIIGGGPAGMAAAVSAWDAGVKDVVILDREPCLGGILQQCIHAGFGLHKMGRELTGPEYAQIYADGVRQRNIPVYYETMVTSVSPDRVVTARNRQGILKLRAQAVILAMGCRERSRGALSIPGARPAGVFSAGTAQKLMNCDGYMVGKRVVILGSGDIGLIMARRLTLEGAKVEAVCELLPYSGGLTRNIVQCLQDFDIPLYLSTTVCRIHGEKRVEGVTVAQVDGRRNTLEETKRFIPCDTLLLSVGLIPENELTRQAGIPMDPITNGPRVDETCETQIPGVFACGNVLQVHDLVDYVSEEAERAGRGAAAFVKKEGREGTLIPTEAGTGVRYVLPQQVHPETDADLELFFRVKQPNGPVRVTASSGDRMLVSRKAIRAVPGEMEKLTVPAEALSGLTEPILVSLEAVK